MRFVNLAHWVACLVWLQGEICMRQALLKMSFTESLIFKFALQEQLRVTKKEKILFQHKSFETKAISDIADFSLKLNVTSFTVINELARHHLDIFGKIQHNFSSLKEFNNCTLWFKTIEDAEIVEAYIKERYENKLTHFRNFDCIEITPLELTRRQQ